VQQRAAQVERAKHNKTCTAAARWRYNCQMTDKACTVKVQHCMPESPGSTCMCRWTSARQTAVLSYRY
jgi:hypothetical protein